MVKLKGPPADTFTELLCDVGPWLLFAHYLH